MNNKIIISGTEVQQAFKEGAKILNDAVVSTLGPQGKTVAINTYGKTVVTKDGVSVAREIQIADPIKNTAIGIMKEAAEKTNTDVGDGTTTSTLLAYEIYEQGIKGVAAGIQPSNLKKGIELATKIVVQNLQELSREVATKEQTKQVATIAANGDEEIGTLIADALEKVGETGIITVEDSHTLDTTLDLVEGMQLGTGYISPYFTTDKVTLEAIWENPYILVIPKKLTMIKPMLPILEKIAEKDKPIVIMCDDAEGEFLASTVVNFVRGTIKICVIKTPGYGSHKNAFVEDVATVVGAKIISDELGMNVENANLTHLGTCKKIIITKDTTTIIEGNGNKAEIEDRIKQIEHGIELSTNDYEKGKFRERLGKLKGNVAVLKVGAATEVEMKEKKDRIEDALNATKASMRNGIVPGGGVALLQIASKFIPFNDNIEIKQGMEIVKKAIQVPSYQILLNAGLEAHQIIARLVRYYTEENAFEMGYNAKTNGYVDVYAVGIIDPTEVVQSALENASSVAAMMLTTNILIVDEPKKEEPKMQMPYGM